MYMLPSSLTLLTYAPSSSMNPLAMDFAWEELILVGVCEPPELPEPPDPDPPLELEPEPLPPLELLPL